jgi:cytochrome P450
MPQSLPVANEKIGLKILRALVRERSLLTPLRLMHQFVGNAFRITLPGFQPAVLVGPQAHRALLVTARDKFSWRIETDPVVKLLRRGILVTDDAEHDHLRAVMEPPLLRGQGVQYIAQMWEYTNAVTGNWRDGETYDMLVEMRRVALLILFGCIFRVDFAPELERLWHPILKLLEYISPGLWIVSPKFPRWGYGQAIREMDVYLYRIIHARRAELAQDENAGQHTDLLTRLCLDETLDDERVRDQLLTMLIAGHDTSTTQLAWTLYLLGTHPDVTQNARAEVDATLASKNGPPSAEEIRRLDLLGCIVKESLRLYPPIHIGNRRARENVCVLDYEIPRDTRVMYSIYLAHRDPQYWDKSEEFCPERFHHTHDEKRPPLTYVPFGGGPRNCIGAAFSQIEALVVLSRLLQQFDFELLNARQIKPHMGATLEPRPGIKMRVTRRNCA